MKPKYITICIRGIVERCDQILERVSSVICKLRKEDLGLFFCEGTHLVSKASLLEALSESSCVKVIRIVAFVSAVKIVS
jgi:hypothetical protein